MRMEIPLEQLVQEVESREKHRPALLGVLDAFMERLDESKERFTDQEYLGACELAKHAYEELGLLHFHACLAGRESARPSELLSALGVRRADANFGALFLAEHVPDAA